ncbi:hypothetical protein CDD83_11133 [Cordyceps sp. RAO-2017]|nr:hypothetical protein CDD83_11133 [Cordyceps sp. RAO-2017]
MSVAMSTVNLVAFSLLGAENRPHNLRVVTRLPKWASAINLLFQPALDFNVDSCYTVPAIGSDGQIDGLGTSGMPTFTGTSSTWTTATSARGRGATPMTGAPTSKTDIGDGLCIGHQYDWEEHVVVWTTHGLPRIGPCRSTAATTPGFRARYPRTQYARQGPYKATTNRGLSGRGEALRGGRPLASARRRLRL